ncbi:hypothetical protein HQ487_05245 [Candidatus Uhrbacteria bacterium]|nr:hypothetical protein [Candidatus Uhrbacteria bacterium]
MGEGFKYTEAEHADTLPIVERTAKERVKIYEKLRGELDVHNRAEKLISKLSVDMRNIEHRLGAITPFVREGDAEGKLTLETLRGEKETLEGLFKETITAHEIQEGVIKRIAAEHVALAGDGQLAQELLKEVIEAYTEKIENIKVDGKAHIEKYKGALESARTALQEKIDAIHLILKEHRPDQAYEFSLDQQRDQSFTAYLSGYLQRSVTSLGGSKEDLTRDIGSKNRAIAWWDEGRPMPIEKSDRSPTGDKITITDLRPGPVENDPKTNETKAPLSVYEDRLLARLEEKKKAWKDHIASKPFLLFGKKKEEFGQKQSDLKFDVQEQEQFIETRKVEIGKIIQEYADNVSGLERLKKMEHARSQTEAFIVEIRSGDLGGRFERARKEQSENSEYPPQTNVWKMESEKKRVQELLEQMTQEVDHPLYKEVKMTIEEDGTETTEE